MEGWANRLEAALRPSGASLFDRVAVVEETESTQDAALALCEGKAGLILVASRQSAGRGRLGRAWVQRDDLGLAATFVLRSGAFGADRLSIAAGLATAMAVDGFVGAKGPMGVRWPNDVVESEPSPGGGRKVAGVLVEVRAGVALLGIGVNVNQLSDDWPPELRGRVVSARELSGSEAPLDRCEVACALAKSLARALAMSLAELIPAWLARDVLRGSKQRFVCGGREVSGVVESLEPSGEIVVRTAGGERVRLPALTTSMVK